MGKEKFDRSNFSLPIAVHPLFGRQVPAIQNKTRSIVRVQLQKLCPQFGRDLFQACEIELADLALVAVAERAVLGGHSRAQQALAQNQLVVADAQSSASHRLEKVPDPGYGKCGFRSEERRVGKEQPC